MDYLNDMALFVEVVKAQSFRRAAQGLGMPNSTLSRRVALLEQGIGLRLMNRTTRKIELTEGGRLYYERCRRIVDEARIAHEELGDMVARPVGLLRVSLPVDFATSYLAAPIHEFATLNPGISFDLDLTPRNVDLVREPFDLAIRMASPENPSLISRVIARLPSECYASPGYIERHGEPAHPDDLASHRCLSMSTMPHWALESGGQTARPAITSHYRMNSMAMIRQMALLGVGVALLSERLVADDLAHGRLRRVLPQWAGAARPIYAVTETRLLPAKTQRFIEFLKKRLQHA
ncbi:LysR family transcriptional regulator [Novosphingobium lindaniclasticum]|uniref:HTH lysR-type domain-containing protein n=1 Tax=Novosphingobium lindaniclasticum LE124 TaxID=1096930 RepID=T0IAR9_9SPHN|nr:LysR substrate-binding domain-containing protein [Novosphingobium lindaniclasticum]EQB08775.1 hypothetical protein L284_20825 [Novosphingobium lindaniclasticum LE124]